MPRYGIAEWYGLELLRIGPGNRRALANVALGSNPEIPAYPFSPTKRQCNKRGGVCSLRLYDAVGDGSSRPSDDAPIALCPSRFDQDNLLLKWLGEIVGFPEGDIAIAREVPFMENLQDKKPAGKIDIVVARNQDNRLEWYGLEIQAVYFSGSGMSSEFEALLHSTSSPPPYPQQVRRPDWRSSSAKRLMPQLEVKVPTLRRWGSKMAVAVDKPFFESIGGPRQNYSQDLGDGDIIWMVPVIDYDERGNLTLQRDHWEMLTLEDSRNKLLSARTVQRNEFEANLRSRLSPLEAES